MIVTSLVLAAAVSAVPAQEAPAPEPTSPATMTAPAWPAPETTPTQKEEETEPERVNPFAPAPGVSPTVTAPPAVPAPDPTTAVPAPEEAVSPWSFGGWLLFGDPSNGDVNPPAPAALAPAAFGGASAWWALTPLNVLMGGGPSQLAPEQTNPVPETPATEPAPEATGTPEPVSVADLIPSGTATSTTAGAEGDAGDDTETVAPAATETATK